MYSLLNHHRDRFGIRSSLSSVRDIGNDSGVLVGDSAAFRC